MELDFGAARTKHLSKCTIGLHPFPSTEVIIGGGGGTERIRSRAPHQVPRNLLQREPGARIGTWKWQLGEPGERAVDVHGRQLDQNEIGTEAAKSANVAELVQRTPGVGGDRHDLDPAPGRKLP